MSVNENFIMDILENPENYSRDQRKIAAHKALDLLDKIADVKEPCGLCPGAFLNPDMNYCPKCGHKLRR